MPPVSSPVAPTAKSSTPLLSKSPMFATEIPKRSPSLKTGPLVVLELISSVDLTEPSVFMYKMCTAPLPLPPSSSACAPTTRSVTPSRLISPMLVIDEPNVSPFNNDGPFVVLSLILTVESIEPSVFMYMM